MTRQLVSKGAERFAAKDFRQQAQTLVDGKFHEPAGLSAQEFSDMLAPLQAKVDALGLTSDQAGARIPYGIVIKSELLPADRAIAKVVVNGKPGFTTLEPEDLARFKPIESLSIPRSPVYLLIDVDTGKDLLNVTPNDALNEINANGRSPLTLDEGLSLLIQFPSLLVAENCFSMLGSRCGDKRVTALWMSEKRPRLGWCWAGNPHTWLGSASCKARAGL